MIFLIPLCFHGWNRKWSDRFSALLNMATEEELLFLQFFFYAKAPNFNFVFFVKCRLDGEGDFSYNLIRNIS